MAKILLCPSVFYPSLGGVEEICRNLGKQLKQKGFDVSVAVNQHSSLLPVEELIDGLAIHRFPFEYPNRSVKGIATISRIPGNINTFLSFVRDYAPEIIHLICPSSNSLYCYLARKFLGRKLLVTLQGEFFMDANKLYQKSAFAKLWASKVLAAADVVTACSQYVMDDAKSRFRFSPEIERVIFNGVDLSEPSSWGGGVLPSHPFVLGVGRLVQNKGFDWLLRSFKMLSEVHASIDLVLAGDGPACTELQCLCKTLGIDNRVYFVGRQNRASIAYLFEHCLFFVMPSPVEPFGIVCLEAMRAGKPVLAANAGGPLEFVDNGGLLIPPLDVARLYKAMNQLCSDTELTQRLGANGKNHVCDFEWTKITDRYIECYRLIADGSAKSRALY